MKIKNSEDCGKYELDLFSVPPTQVVVDEGYWDDIRPHPNFQKSTIQFDISGDSNNYISLADSELWLTVSLINSEGKPIDADKLKDLGPVNNFFHSIFSQIQVSLNHNDVENSNSIYPYRAYIENLLCYGKESKETFLTQEMWYKDTPGKMGAVFDTPRIEATGTTQAVPASFGNQGLMKRLNKFKNGNQTRSIQLRGHIHSDIFNMNRFMLANVSVQLKLTRARPDFYLLSKSDLQGQISAQIDDCFLRIRRVKVSPSIMMHHAMALEKTAAKYPIKRVMLKYFALPFLTPKVNIANIHTGVMPTRLIFGLVPSEAFDGKSNQNPFDFKHMNVSSIRLKVTSKYMPYSSGLQLDYNNDQYMQGYNTLFQNIREAGNDISYEDYKNGYALYAFNLSPDLCGDSEQFSELKDGTLELDIDFDKITEGSTTIVVYMEFDNVIEITKQRNVLFDYQV